MTTDCFLPDAGRGARARPAGAVFDTAWVSERWVRRSTRSGKLDLAGERCDVDALAVGRDEPPTVLVLREQP
jgi:hypothetical protein